MRGFVHSVNISDGGVPKSPGSAANVVSGGLEAGTVSPPGEVSSRATLQYGPHLQVPGSHFENST